MTNKPSLTQDDVRYWFDYNPDTGAFLWRRAYYYQQAGSEAGLRPSGPTNYCQVKLLGTVYPCSRLIWIYMTGAWPEGNVLYKDNDRLNLKWENLYIGTANQTQYHRTMNSNNSSGVKGASWNSEFKKWHCAIRVNGKDVFVGRYTNIDDAEIALQEARQMYHGNFASDGQETEAIPFQEKEEVKGQDMTNNLYQTWKPVIEDNIPVPSKSVDRYSLKLLEKAGQSIFIPCNDESEAVFRITVQNNMQTLRNLTHNKYKSAVAMKDGVAGVRVWLVTLAADRFQGAR